MGNSAIVSVVIACHNDADYITQAVTSAREQTYSPLEIIVVDDGSNAQTKEVLQALASKIDLLITQDNKGVCVARNQGIEKASGEYIFILDSDDFIASNYLEQAVIILQNDPEVKIVSSYAQTFNSSKKLKILQPLGGNVKEFLITNRALGTSLYRKEDLLKIGGYDENLKSGYEDWELNLHLLADGGKASIIEEPLYFYRIKDGSRNKKAQQNKYELMNYIYKKHTALVQENFPMVLDRLFFILKREENKKELCQNSLEYRLGKKLLYPLRMLKKLGSNN